MHIDIVRTELMKYRRTVIPWMIAGGGFLAAGTALVQDAYDNKRVEWAVYAFKSFNSANLLALLLVATFTGFVFSGEHRENTESVMFAYPVSRWRFYFAKILAVLFFDVSLFASFLLSFVFFGFIYTGHLPAASFIMKSAKLALEVSAVNFVLVPVTVLAGMAVRGIATYIFAGMCYFMVYLSFINSDAGLFVPVCLPDRLAACYFTAGRISAADMEFVVFLLTEVFIIPFIIGAVWYSRRDIYR